VWYLIPVIPALSRGRQKDDEFGLHSETLSQKTTKATKRARQSKIFY
jgi:hypothetical protein